MAVGRMDDHRHPCTFSCPTPQNTCFGRMGMDYIKMLHPYKMIQLDKRLNVFPGMDFPSKII